jgi:hypothetical protein
VSPTVRPAQLDGTWPSTSSPPSSRPDAIKRRANCVVDDDNRPAAAAVYNKYREPFLIGLRGATSKQLFVRDEDVQVVHVFASADDATAYLSSELFTADVVRELSPLLASDPDIRVYEEA